jgi:heavy metal sensor kinase
MSFFHSIKFRFTLWYLVVLGVLLGAFSFGIYFYMSSALHDNLDDSLKLRAEQLSQNRGVFLRIEQDEFQEELGEVVLLYLKGKAGLTQISPRELDIPFEGDLSDIVAGALEGQRSFATVQTAQGRELRMYAVPASEEGPGFMPGERGMMIPKPEFEKAAVVVGRSTAETDEALDRLAQTLLIVVPLTIMVAGAGGVFLARRAFKPVDQMTQTALEIEETDLSRRIPVKSRDELGRLGSTLNQMIERLEKAFKRQQQFTGDASHELRTPLAVIEAESSLALQRERSASDYRESLEMISQEAVHMSVIIDQLLTLARADYGAEQFVFEEIDLGEALSDVASDAEVLCREKGLAFEYTQTENPKVKGDRAKLRQLFLNLLANAIRYTPEAGRVSISLGQEDRMAVVAVSDTGIGIPQDELPLIFERFYRIDKGRSRGDGGSGLGLAICKYIAEAQNGTIEVTSEDGKGSTFSVWLPVAVT